MKAAELLRLGFALVVGWTDPEGSRPYLGALLLAYYDPEERLIYAGRVGTGINTAELQRLERGRFIWPSPADGVVAISAPQLAYMLDGIDWRNPVHTWRPQVAG